MSTYTAEDFGPNGAAVALAVKDLISEEQFNTLYGPWASVIGAAK